MLKKKKKFLDAADLDKEQQTIFVITLREPYAEPAKLYFGIGKMLESSSQRCYTTFLQQRIV